MNNQIHFFSQGCRFLIKDKKEIRGWIEEVIQREDRIPGEINFIFMDDAALLNYNLKYLNTNTYTDIITFPLSDEEQVISGDVYISIERVEENAKRYKVNFKEELRRILIHGVLHLIGYEDILVNDKRKMTRLENKFLKLYSKN
ncbi:MAG: rRNA maturation RNase YbeY [Bacteroidetes bacterium]|nr:rRNA maturation RNase YbeY [Bacteroidota bacterium]